MGIYDVYAILAGQMGPNQQATMTVCFAIMTVFNTVGLGFQEGAITIIGNLIGAQKLNEAK